MDAPVKTRMLTRSFLMALALVTPLSAASAAAADPSMTSPTAAVSAPGAASPAPPSPSAPPPPATPSSGPPLAEPPAPATSAPTRNAVALGAAGIAAAAAIGATVFGALALHNKSAYDNNPTYANTDDGNNFAAYSDGCIALAAAAGITSLVLFLTAPKDGPASAGHAALSALPVVTPHAGGAGAVLRF